MAASDRNKSFLDGLQERMAKKSSSIAKVRDAVRNRIGLNEAERKERAKKTFLENYVRDRVSNQRLRGGRGGAHYGESLNTDHMIAWSEAVAASISEKFDSRTHYPVLLYRGMSGIVAATHLFNALLRQGTEHGMGYVRKDNERSHGSSVERYNLPDHNLTKVIFIFCDDFVCGGDTLRETVKKFQLAMQFRLQADQIWTALSDCQKYIRPVAESISTLQKDLDQGWEEVMKKFRADAESEWEHKVFMEEHLAQQKKEALEREADMKFIPGTGVSAIPPTSLQNDSEFLCSYIP